MGRFCYEPEPLIGVRNRTGFGAKSHRSISTKTDTYRPIERFFKDLHTGSTCLSLQLGDLRVILARGVAESLSKERRLGPTATE